MLLNNIYRSNRRAYYQWPNRQVVKSNWYNFFDKPVPSIEKEDTVKISPYQKSNQHKKHQRSTKTIVKPKQAGTCGRVIRNEQI